MRAHISQRLHTRRVQKNPGRQAKQMQPEDSCTTGASLQVGPASWHNNMYVSRKAGTTRAAVSRYICSTLDTGEQLTTLCSIMK